MFLFFVGIILWDYNVKYFYINWVLYREKFVWIIVNMN